MASRIFAGSPTVRNIISASARSATTFGARPPSMVPIFRVLPPSEESSHRSDHRSDDALGIAGTAAPDEIAVLVRTKERWHGIHVRGKRHSGLTPEREDIVPIGFGENAFDLPVVPCRKGRQMREEVVAHIFFVAGGRLDVHKCAR